MRSTAGDVTGVLREGTRPSDIAATLGRCPHPGALVPDAQLNRGVAGIESVTVPIDALTVHVCEYGGIPDRLLGAGSLDAAETATFEAQTNHLPAQAPEPYSCGPAGQTHFLVTFANKTEQVSIAASGPICSVAWNGARSRGPTQEWLDELNAHIKA